MRARGNGSALSLRSAWQAVGVGVIVLGPLALSPGCELLAGVRDGTLLEPGSGGVATTSSPAGAAPGGGNSPGGTGGAGNAGAGTTSQGGAGATAGGGAHPDYSATVLADGPVAYWRLGEPIGPAALDSGPHGHDGTFMGASISYGQPGAIAGDADTAIHFAGTSLGRVAMGDVLAFPARAPFSLELWARPDRVDGAVASRCVFDSGLGYRGYGIVLPSNPDEFRFRRNSARATSPIETYEAYTHVVGTYDGWAIRLYVDGVLRATADATDDLEDIPAEFLLGEMPSWGRYTGDLDEVAVYDYSLPPDRIAAHHEAGRGRLQRSPTFP